ncbi:MAG: 2-amino-4-hydroxy-6-hydroxymethyldihydropteridine diphosphokinase [Succinivibrionaceae bacterium]
MVTAFIALGSNLDNPVNQLRTAIEEISRLKGCELSGISGFYENPPLGPQDQPSFLNGVIKITTNLRPLELLDKLQELEQKHRRVRKIHWGPRTLDLDIILYGNETISNSRLTVPHPEVARRSFVLRPLLDIEPDLSLPDGRKISELCAETDCNGLKKIDIFAGDPHPA